MTKDKNYDVSLVSVGTIDSELHFGPFSYEWWIVCNQEMEFLVPIRLHMKVVTHLSGHDFILTVVKGNREHFEQPGYICTCESFYTTEPSISSSNAISTVYQQMFHTKTRFS
ncbi:17573_t:CDS:1, partial [Funneliformis caledonium]